MNNTPNNGDSLHDDVLDLTRSVQALKLTLESDYPTRREVRRRRWQVTAAMVTAIIASYFITVSSISYCFLNGVPAEGEKKLCEIFPGYRESFQNNLKFIGSYQELQEYVKTNEDRIARLEEAEANEK